MYPCCETTNETNLFQTMRRSTPHFIEAIVVLDCVGQSHSRCWRWILLQCCNCFKLRRHITFVSQLKLPLEIGLLNDNGTQNYHLWIETNPQYR